LPRKPIPRLVAVAVVAVVFICTTINKAPKGELCVNTTAVEKTVFPSAWQHYHMGTWNIKIDLLRITVHQLSI